MAFEETRFLLRALRKGSKLVKLERQVSQSFPTSAPGIISRDYFGRVGPSTTHCASLELITSCSSAVVRVAATHNRTRHRVLHPSIPYPLVIA